MIIDQSINQSIYLSRNAIHTDWSVVI